MPGYSGYNLPSVDELSNGTGMASPANTRDYMNLGMGGNIPLSYSMDYGSKNNQGGYMNAGLGVNVNPMSPSVFSSNNGAAGGIGSIRPPSQKAIDASRPGGLPEWMDWDNLGNAAYAVGALGSVWAGIQQNKLAKETLAFKKKSYAEEVDFQKKSYNTELGDRARSRASFSGQGSDYVSAYMNKNQL